MPEKEAMRFAKNLSYYVGQTGKSRKEICSDLGIQYSTFSEWLHGRKYPRITKISLLADYFGIRIADLIEEKVSIPNINKDLLLQRILHSKELTALEKRYLENLVRADGSAKVGHWIDRTDWTVLEYGKFGHPAYECSECGYKKRTPNEGSFDPHKGGKFCDECGVRMIEREEREYFTVPICGGKNDVE